MSEQARVVAMDPKAASSANIVYILYLVGLIIGITPLVGVIMAYLNRGEAPDWVKSHYQFQIRTFWIGLLASVVGALLIIILVGWIILLVAAIWWIVRCVKGMQYLGRQQPYPDPTTWMF
jgi:uncharacterized membrane protein